MSVRTRARVAWRWLAVAISGEVALLAAHAVVVAALGQEPIAAAMLSAPASATAWLGAVAVLTRIGALALWPAGVAFLAVARAASTR